MCCKGVKLSKTQIPTMAENRKENESHSYASVIGSIKYAMLCTRPIVWLANEFGKGVQ